MEEYSSKSGSFPRKVLVVSTYLKPFSIGGAEISTRLLAEELANAGIETIILTLKHKEKKGDLVVPKNPLLKIIYAPAFLENIPKKFTGFFMRSFIFYGLFARLIFKAVKNHQIRIIHIQDRHALIPGWIASKLSKTPVTFTARDPILICPYGMCLVNGGKPHPLSFRESLSCKWALNAIFSSGPQFRFRSVLTHLWAFVDTHIKRIAYQRCNGSIFVSDGLKKLYEQAGLKHSSRITIYNIPGLQPNSSKNAIPSSLEIIKTIKEQNKRIVVTLGKLSYGKGTQILLDAIPRVIDEFPDTYFVFAGSHSKQTMPFHIHDQTDQNIIFLGRIDFEDVPYLYRLSDILCQPSIWPEPLSRTLLEAMAFQKPIVATNVGGTQEVVHHDKNGLLVPPSNSERLAQAICKLINDPKKMLEMGKEGVEILNAYNHNQMIDRTISHYISIMV